MAASLGEFVLVVGDMHIPHRAATIPEGLRKMLVPGKMQHVICTGNLVGKEQIDALKELAPNVHTVRGDFDENPNAYPETKVVQVGEFKIGICHGHQIVPWGDVEALEALQRQLDCDVLVTGHTHVNDVHKSNGKLFVNPGSITGAYTATVESVIPSFALMAIKDKRVVVFVYELKDGELKVGKTVHTKED